MNKIIYTLHQKFKMFFFISEDRCLKKAVRVLTKYCGSESKEYFCYAAVYLSRPQKCFFSSEWFGKPEELEFEDGRFYVPSDSHSVLTKLYSNYMELPPESERIPTHGTGND